ncbi:MAG: hypothetical protein AB7J40_01590 [Candidatus Altimarinota bacterium]
MAKKRTNTEKVIEHSLDQAMARISAQMQEIEQPLSPSQRVIVREEIRRRLTIALEGKEALPEEKMRLSKAAHHFDLRTFDQLTKADVGRRKPSNISPLTIIDQLIKAGMTTDKQLLDFYLKVDGHIGSTGIMNMKKYQEKHGQHPVGIGLGSLRLIRKYLIMKGLIPEDSRLLSDIDWSKG